MEQTLGKRIMTNRKRLGMTQDQLAEKLGVTAQAVSKWENDQSCPDITILPQLADIFGISTDSLLGREREEKVYDAEIVTDNDDQEPEGVHIHNGNISFVLNSGKRNAIWLALLVLAVGALYLGAQVFSWKINFGEILWVSALIIFGLSGIYPKFSLLRTAIGIFGIWYLLFKLIPLSNGLDGSIVISVCILLVGLNLLIKAIKKPSKPFVHVTHKGSDGREKQQLNIDEESFDYRVSFGSCTQPIAIPCLRSGSVQCSFGEYKLDLSAVEKVYEGCSVQAQCSFGELTLLIPSKFSVKPNCSTAFAEIETRGLPSSAPEGVIQLDANASFGQIVIEYI